MGKKKEEKVLSLPVAYGGLSVGDKTARIGLSISRGNLTIAAADRTFCCRRLDLKIKAMSNGAQVGSKPLPGMDDPDYSVQGIADVKGWSTNGKTISFGLTFMIENVDLETLTHFPKREGMLEVDAVFDIPEDEQEGEED